MQRETAQIWLPPRYTFMGVKEARQAAIDYDPNLDFGWNEKTQQWCVYLKEGTMQASEHGDLPILGFRGTQPPSREEIHERLYKSDALRRGNEIIDEWNRQNDALKNRDTSDIDGQVAEHFAWGFKKMGSDKAPVQVYMPGDK